MLLLSLGILVRSDRRHDAAQATDHRGAPASPSGTATPPPAMSVDHPTVRATIAVGAEPQGVAVAPDNRTVYVANQGSHVVSVIDVASRRVTPIFLKNTPRFVAVAADGTRVYVSMYENDASGSGVAVLSSATDTVVNYLTTGPQPYTLAVAPGGQLWVPIHGSHRLEIYEPNDPHPPAAVQVAANPHAVAFAPDLMRAFTPDHESNAVSVIDLRTDRQTQTVPVSAAPHSLALAPDQRTVVVACYQADAINLIDAATLRRTGPFSVGHHPRSVAFAADGGHAYVVNEADNTVSVINPRTGATTATIPVGRNPRTIAVAPDGRFAYVSNGADNSVTVLDLAG